MQQNLTVGKEEKIGERILERCKRAHLRQRSMRLRLSKLRTKICNHKEYVFFGCSLSVSD